MIGKQRLEAFSDGVLAVAVTLLVLDLHADPASPDSLAAQLRQEWPSFVAYLVSFFIVGVIWINHHALFALVARVDRLLMFYNLLLLLFVTTIPFTTSTLAGYLLVGGPDSRLAVVLYGASMEGMAISFTLILWHLIRRGLLLRPVSPARRPESRAPIRPGQCPVPVDHDRRAPLTGGHADPVLGIDHLLYRRTNPDPAGHPGSISAPRAMTRLAAARGMSTEGVDEHDREAGRGHWVR